MAFQAAKEFLEKRGFGDRIKEFDVSSATVELAAVAVGCEPAHIAKTLSFLTGEGPVLIVAAGDAKIDNHKYKSFFGVKAKMLTVEQVSELIGHEVGGVCPYGIKEGVKVYLDESLKRFDVVYPACGSSNSAVNCPSRIWKSPATLNSGWMCASCFSKDTSIITLLLTNL